MMMRDSEGGEELVEVISTHSIIYRRRKKAINSTQTKLPTIDQRNLQKSSCEGVLDSRIYSSFGDMQGRT